MTNSKSKRFWNFTDNFAGDSVVLIITLLLMLFSIIFIFSSSSRLLTANTSRLDIVADHLQIVGLGLVLVIGIYNIRSIEFFRKLSAWGFFVAFFFLLALLIIHKVDGIGIFTAPTTNGAVRYIQVNGLQIHVYEIVKVSMVMYIAWAVDALKRNNFKLLDKLSELEHMKWLGSHMAKKVIFLYIPFAVVIAMVMMGSNTAALIIGLILLLTIVIGTGEIKEILYVGGAMAAIVLSCFLLYSLTKTSEHPLCGRVGTAISRLTTHYGPKDYHNAKTFDERQAILDNMRQPYSAKIAIHQGGLIGKGPGQSTQRYVVPDMSEDYMFSFILEEYGFFGGMAVMILYLSLFARGVLIVRNCGNNLFAKCAVMGLVLLISGQAMIHFAVNADLGLLTGQTLPLLSHGASAFVCFSIAFGVILSISRIANKGMKKESKKAEPLFELHDTIQADLASLEQFEADDRDQDIDEYDI